ncbi:leucine-rich repeat domain-containing protein [Listeria welshimeri]|uniref:leucine-rich repeat domain-containing protein n=1 Tax=Listeria welshimeri TaxID=1643 RepID=UPI0022709713|nr:leucine-rich repeat domain-containing protein [Listeria welshimeri]
MKDKKHFQRLFVVLTIIIGINVWIGTSGETEVKAANITQPTPINQVFPDANLAGVIQRILQKPNVSAPVTQDELNAMEIVEGIYGVEGNIASIEGVQYLNNLTELRLDGINNSISDLHPLSGLIHLKDIDLSHNQISDLSPLSDLIKLTSLHMNHNKISDISPLSDLTNLTSLWISDNQINDLSALFGLISLAELHSGENQINNLTPLSGLTNLTTLVIYQNKISNIRPLSSLTNLNILIIGKNKISDITPLFDLTNLTALWINENEISDISSLSGLNNVWSLDVSGNQINDISSINSLKNLYVLKASNQIIVNKPVNYQQNLVLQNNNIDRTGKLVSPNGISDSGSYTSPHIIWDLPDYKKQVSYTFDNGDSSFPFTGTVVQPLIEVPVSYKVVFDVDEAETSETVAKDTLLTPPANPVKEGYTFTGWYDEKIGGTEWDFATDKMPAKDITLYAQFSKNSSDEGTPGDKGQDEGAGGKDGTTDKPTEPDLQPVDKPTNNSPQLKDTQSTLSVKAKHVSGSKEQGAKEKSSLPATGDDSIFTLYLQASGILFLVAFFWISIKRKKKVNNEK